MSEGRGRAQWAHTAAILALIANVNRNPKTHGPFESKDFNPYQLDEKSETIPQTNDLSILKAVFVDRAR